MNRRRIAIARQVGMLFDELPVDEEAVQKLESLLLHDDDALRTYVELVDLDARLQWIHRGSIHLQQTDSFSAPHTPNSETSRSQGARSSTKRKPRALAGLSRVRAALIGLAASLLLVSTAAYYYSTSAIGKITAVAAVKWSDPSVSLSRGSRIGIGQLDLLEGVIEITLRNDTRLIVEGPSSLQLHSDMEAYLVDGTVSVFVGDAVDEYVVNSLDARVVDLGTAFQVSSSDVGTDIHVIDGKVMAYALNATQGSSQPSEAHLSKQEAVRVNRDDGRIERVAFAGGRMKLRGGDAPLSAIPVAVTGAINCLETPPPSVVDGKLEDNDHMHLFLECSGRSPSKSVFADRNSKGETAKDLGGNLGLEIPAGTRVNSYLLHYDPTNESWDYTLHRVSGTIEFRTPIIGVFHSGVGLRTSDRMFCNENTEYLDETDLFGRRDMEHMDFVSFSPDRRTLIVNFEANTGVDQLRIITMDEDPR